MQPKACTVQEWYDLVGRVCPMWDRASPDRPFRIDTDPQCHITASFSGYKPYEYMIAQDALLALGGPFMQVVYDATGGRTWVLIREPRHLDSRWEAIDATG